MKKVILMALSDIENIGDLFIPKCVQYLVSNNKSNEWESQIVSLIPPKNDFRYLVYGGLKVISRLLPKSDLSHKIVYKANKIREWRYYRKQIKEADAIIFSLGSYKYTTQDLWTYYVQIIQIAEKMNIPVMFDAMNVQEYCKDDWRCQLLKKYTNYSCVKVFTTRDGIMGVNELKNNYITNQDIKIAVAGDPAYWIPECYQIEKKSGTKIGINLIRGNIFTDYGKKTTKEELLFFYETLIHQLDEKHMKWELFTNGMRQDRDFGIELLSRMKRRNVTIRVPESDQELAQLIAGYKGIIGARLHACICAYSLDVPVVGFIWDKKMLGFAQISKLESYFVNEANLTAENMLNALEMALESKYDREQRNVLKRITRDTICEFLENARIGA